MTFKGQRSHPFPCMQLYSDWFIAEKKKKHKYLVKQILHSSKATLHSPGLCEELALE